MTDALYIGFRDEVGTPTGPTDDQEKAIRQWNHPDTLFHLLKGGSGSGKTSLAVKLCIDTAMQYPGLEMFWGHLHLHLFEPGPFTALRNIVPKVLVNVGSNMAWTLEFKKDTSGSRFVVIRIPGFIHPTKGYTAKITYWGLDQKYDWVRRLEKQGGSFGLGYFDQLDLLPDDSAFRAFITRFRSKPMKFIATTNPDKSGWWHRYWGVDPLFVNQQSDNYVESILNPSGNPHVHGKYEATMRNTLSSDQVTRMVDGVDIFEGEKVFSEFDPVENTTDVPSPIPSDWILDEWWDYGWNDPANVLLTAITPENECIFLDILRRNHTIPSEFAEIWIDRKNALLSRGRLHGEASPKIRHRICDPRMFNNGPDGSKPVADQIAAYEHPSGERIFLTPSSLKRVAPNQNIRFSQLIAAKELFARRVFKVGRNCAEFFEEHDSFVWDEKTQMPKDYRKRGRHGVVIHHHDTMDNILRLAGTLYIMSPDEELKRENSSNGYSMVRPTRESSGVIKMLKAFTC